MNKYTLIFHNSTTEQNYQKQQIDMMVLKLLKVCNLVIISELAAIITMTINNQLIELFVALMLGLPVIPIAYLIKHNQQYKKYVPLLFQVLSQGCSFFPWIKYLIVGAGPYDMIISECCTLALLCYIPSINFIYNCFTILLYNFTRSSMHFVQQGYSPYNIIYIVFSFVLIFNDYYSMLIQKQYYLITQENMLQNQTIDVFSKEKILITKFDHESFAFKNILVNQKLQQMMKQNELDNIILISNIKGVKIKLAIISQLQQNNYQSQSNQFSLIGYIQKKRIKIEIMVQRFVEKIYIIKFDMLNYSIQSNSAVLYTRFIRKIRQESQSQIINVLINKEIIQNLIINACRNTQIKLTPKQVSIDFYRVFHNIGIKIYEIYDKLQKPFISDPLVLSAIIYLINKVCKIEQMLVDFKNNHYFISLMGLKCNESMLKNLGFQQGLNSLKNYIAIDDILFKDVRDYFKVNIHFQRSYE
ncbi:hypothetical protein pb186bvf_014177 [Paramecium bursaria]